MINAFGKSVPPLQEIVSQQTIREFLHDTLEKQLSLLDVRDARKLAGAFLMIARDLNPGRYQEFGREWIKEHVPTNKLSQALNERSWTMYQEVKEHVKRSTVLDYGCGNGAIGNFLAQEGHDVTFADVYRSEGMPPYYPFRQVGQLVEEQDTTLLLTVLHHSDTPIESLQEAVGATKTGGRLIVIESVYGVRSPEMGHLNDDEQFLAASFIDLFANRMLLDSKYDINVPCNFQRPEEWEQRFEREELQLLHQEDLGIDLPIFPEHHWLYVVEKQ